jgi:dTDP-4-dehydrorhamnose reductase
MKILLTGKTGQVGYELRRSLQGLGDVVAVDLDEMDLSDLDQIREVIRRVKPNLIVNPAAYTAVDKAEAEPELAMRINGEAPAVMAAEARKLGAAMIHYSTDYVFDGTKTTPYVETDTPCPINVYGATKLAGEQAIQAAGIPHLILRTSWVYGMRGKNFLLTVKRLAQERDELRIVGDQFGSPTWCRTIADTTALLIARFHDLRETSKFVRSGSQEDLSGIYHLTCQGRTSWHGFTEAILSQAGIEKKPIVTAITTSEFPLPARRPMNSELSCTRLQSLNLALPEWRVALDLCHN